MVAPLSVPFPGQLPLTIIEHPSEPSVGHLGRTVAQALVGRRPLGGATVASSDGEIGRAHV